MLKVYLLLFSVVIPKVTLVEKEIFTKDSLYSNMLCPFASLDFGFHKKVTGCAAMCNMIPTCRSFFYNKMSQVCKGATGVLSTTFGCQNMPGTTYYKTTDATTTTSTTTSTTAVTMSTTAITVPVSQYGSTCAIDADCPLSAETCLQGTCSCIAGYRYNPSSDSCVINCVTYGSTYIEYPQMGLTSSNIAEYTGVTLSQCLSYCSSSSTCPGLTYTVAIFGGRCRLKSDTPYTNPGAVSYFPNVYYYTRNCA